VILLKRERKKTLKSFDTIYQKTIRPLCLEFFGVLISSLLRDEKNTFTRCIYRQYKKLHKTKTVSITTSAVNYLSSVFRLFIRTKNKELKSKGIKITIQNNCIYFRSENIHNCLMSIEIKNGKASGWTKLYKAKGVYIHEISLTGIPVEFYASMLFLPKHSIKYILKDILFQMDSIYHHEQQHVLDDVNTKILGSFRADDYYYKILERNTSYYYNRYLHHPAEQAANMRQLAFLLHYMRPKNTKICAVRFYNFFQRYKAPRYATSFKESEVCKYSTLFKATKKHTKHWYVFMFKLLNMKYYQLYGCSILKNINTLKNKL
jgi:hypothetical protein